MFFPVHFQEKVKGTKQRQNNTKSKIFGYYWSIFGLWKCKISLPLKKKLLHYKTKYKSVLHLKKDPLNALHGKIQIFATLNHPYASENLKVK